MRLIGLAGTLLRAPEAAARSMVAAMVSRVREKMAERASFCRSGMQTPRRRLMGRATTKVRERSKSNHPRHGSKLELMKDAEYDGTGETH